MGVRRRFSFAFLIVDFRSADEFQCVISGLRSCFLSHFASIETCDDFPLPSIPSNTMSFPVLFDVGLRRNNFCKSNNNSEFFFAILSRNHLWHCSKCNGQFPNCRGARRGQFKQYPYLFYANEQFGQLFHFGSRSQYVQRSCPRSDLPNRDQPQRSCHCEYDGNI